MKWSPEAYQNMLTQDEVDDWICYGWNVHHWKVETVTFTFNNQILIGTGLDYCAQACILCRDSPCKKKKSFTLEGRREVMKVFIMSSLSQDRIPGLLTSAWKNVMWPNKFGRH
jgi:hypothetical protein